MTESAAGLVMRTRLLTETSLIVHWLTPNFGRLATVAKGAQRPKSPFRGKLDLFYLADFSFRRSRVSDLHTLSEVSLRETHGPLRRDLACLRQAAYCAALIEQATEQETPLPALFELMLGFLRHVCGQKPEPHALFAFELKLLDHLGIKPDLEQSRLKAGTRQVANALTQGDWPVVSRLKPSRAQAAELGLFLRGFLEYHLERIPNGRDVALERTHDG
jgi:DNA repair protein RecO (recombination protein O)